MACCLSAPSQYFSLVNVCCLHLRAISQPVATILHKVFDKSPRGQWVKQEIVCGNIYVSFLLFPYYCLGARYASALSRRWIWRNGTNIDLIRKKTKKLVHKQNHPKMQKTLEDVIIEINKSIVEINITNNMIMPFICDTIMFKTGSSLKRKYQKFPDGLHPGTQVYQEWGKILANGIDTNFSRSVGEDGACKLDFPTKTPTPCPVEEHSSSPDGKRKRHWKTYWVLQNLGF